MILTFNLQENGRTILLCAVETGDIDLVQTLLEHGADVNIVGMVCQIIKFRA